MNGRKMLLWLLTVTLIFQVTGCKSGKGVGNLGKEAVETLERNAHRLVRGRSITSEERSAYRYIEKLYQPELSEKDKNSFMYMLLPDDTLKRNLKNHGPDSTETT